MDHTKAAFASVCGFDTKSLSVYISRKQVVVNGEGMIDINHPVNKKFLEKRLEKIKAKENQTQSPVTEKSQEIKKAAIDGLSLTQLTRERKIADLKKLDKEIDLLSIKKEKLQGEVIPTEFVKILMYKRISALTHRIKDHWEDHLIKLASEVRLSGEQLAKMRGEMVNHINQANEQSVETVKREIMQGVNEFRTVRSRGEKK